MLAASNPFAVVVLAQLETRLTEADTATLNQWAINVLQADTLEAVFNG